MLASKELCCLSLKQLILPMAAIAAAVAALLLLQPRVGPAQHLCMSPFLHAAVPHQPYCKNLRGGYQEVR